MNERKGYNALISFSNVWNYNHFLPLGNQYLAIAACFDRPRPEPLFGLARKDKGRLLWRLKCSCVCVFFVVFTFERYFAANFLVVISFILACIR